MHTPVIAPVTIKGTEETTQLIKEHKTGSMSTTEEEKKEYGLVKDGNAAYEMILDNEYTFTFDPGQHRDIQGYGWSEDSTDGTGYRKYIKNRWVRFPFTVQIKDNETETWSPFYKVGSNGYTDWINVYEEEDYGNCWYSDDTTFYIPPWAIEGNYSEKGEGRLIEYKVEAYNVDDENGGGHQDDQEDYANSDNLAGERDNEAQAYVATYKVPVELSGIIYNFEIIGSNYYSDYNFALEDGAIPFAPFRMEKKQGNMLIYEADTFENMGITDQDGDGEIDYWDYMAQTGETLDKEADFWLNKNVYPYGYLMLNFNIVTFNEGQPHLSYWSGTKDMWKLQGMKETVTIGDPGVEAGSDGKYPISIYDSGYFYCVPSMALILLVQVQSRVFTAKCSEPQVGAGNGMDEGSGVAKFLSLRTET